MLIGNKQQIQVDKTSQKNHESHECKINKLTTTLKTKLSKFTPVFSVLNLANPPEILPGIFV